MGEHTPTPWVFELVPVGRNGRRVPKIYTPGSDGDAICQPFDKNGEVFLDATANAAFIVKACNSHDALVKALEELQAAETSYRMCHDLDGDGHINTGRAWDKLRQAGQRARAAIAKTVTQSPSQTLQESQKLANAAARTDALVTALRRIVSLDKENAARYAQSIAREALAKVSA